MILAVGSVFAGFLGIPNAIAHAFGGHDWNWIHHFLEPVYAVIDGHGDGEIHHLSTPMELALMALSVAVAVTGILIARAWYGGDKGLTKGEATAARFSGLHKLLVNKYYVDEIYDAIIVKPLRGLSRFFWRGVDGRAIDGSIHLGAYLTRLFGDFGRLTTTGNVRNYALYFFLGIVALLTWVLL
jgi:NADH-quinone oxidoreductase subunit L